MFAISLGLCAYNFFRAISLDPGTCPKPTSDAELKSVSIASSELVVNYRVLMSEWKIIEDLAAEGRLNGQTFCIQCMVRSLRFCLGIILIFGVRLGSPCARSTVAHAIAASLARIST